MNHFVSIIASSLLVTSTMAGEDVHVTLDIPPVLVQGFPAPLSITILNDRPHSLDIMPGVDFATDLSGSQGAGLAVNFKGPAATYYVGNDGYGRPESEGGKTEGTWSLDPWQKATLSFDLAQILLKSTYGTGSQLPVPGNYDVTVSLYFGTWKSAPRGVTIREPTPDEKRFLEAIQKQGIGKKWFPAAITDDNLQVPDDIPLPAETAQLRNFIKVLRLAVRNPDAAVNQIEDRKDTWGHLQDAVTELKYECVAKVKGKDSAGAQDIRRTLDTDAKTKGRLTRLENAGGLLDHFAEIKAAKPKDR